MNIVGLFYSQAKSNTCNAQANGAIPSKIFGVYFTINCVLTCRKSLWGGSSDVITIIKQKAKEKYMKDQEKIAEAQREQRLAEEVRYLGDEFRDEKANIEQRLKGAAVGEQQERAQLNNEQQVLTARLGDARSGLRADLAKSHYNLNRHTATKKEYVLNFHPHPPAPIRTYPLPCIGWEELLLLL